MCFSSTNYAALVDLVGRRSVLLDCHPSWVFFMATPFLLGLSSSSMRKPQRVSHLIGLRWLIDPLSFFSPFFDLWSRGLSLWSFVLGRTEA